MAANAWRTGVLVGVGWVLRIWAFSIRLFIIAWIGALFLGLTEPSSTEESRRSPGASPGLIEQFQVSGQVWSLAFSADNTHLAAATLTGEVIVKDLSAGHMLRLCDGPTPSVLTVAFSPRESILAFTGAHPALRLWDAHSAAPLAEFDAGVETARSLAFSPDGTMLAIGAWLGPDWQWTVSVWDFKSRSRLALLDVDRAVIKGLAFSADGARLAVGDTGGTVTLWDVCTWRKIATLQAHRPSHGGVVALASSPHDALIATAGAFESTVRLWHAATGRSLGALTTSSSVYALCFSPGRPLLVTAQENGDLGVWDPVAGQQLGVLQSGGGRLPALALSSDGRLLATSGADGTVRLWDFERVLVRLSVSQALATRNGGEVIDQGAY